MITDKFPIYIWFKLRHSFCMQTLLKPIWLSFKRISPSQSKKRKICETAVKYKLPWNRNGIGFTNPPAGSMLSTQSPQSLKYLPVHITLHYIFINWTKQPATSSFLLIKWKDWKTNFTLHILCNSVCTNYIPMPKHNSTARELHIRMQSRELKAVLCVRSIS